MAISISSCGFKVINLEAFSVFFSFMGPDAHYAGDVKQLYTLTVLAVNRLNVLHGLYKATPALDLSLILCLHLPPLICNWCLHTKSTLKVHQAQRNYHLPRANIKTTKSEMWVSMTRCYPIKVDSRAEGSVNHTGPVGLQQ